MSEELAKLFHEQYEKLAPDFDYKTPWARPIETWAQIPERNKKLMIAVCSVVMETVLADKDDRIAELEKYSAHYGELYALASYVVLHNFGKEGIDDLKYFLGVIENANK